MQCACLTAPYSVSFNTAKLDSQDDVTVVPHAAWRCVDARTSRFGTLLFPRARFGTAIATLRRSLPDLAAANFGSFPVEARYAPRCNAISTSYGALWGKEQDKNEAFISRMSLKVMHALRAHAAILIQNVFLPSTCEREVMRCDCHLNFVVIATFSRKVMYRLA